MSALIILRHIVVENANAISGLTWGFPAITHFLGYTHALSRKLEQSHGLTLSGCGVICHQQQVHAYSSGRDSVFALTRNPLTKEAKTSAFNEEGRMHMTVSLLLECHGVIPAGENGGEALQTHLAGICPVQRLAGGTIKEIGQISVMSWPENERASRKILRRLLPGFALLDRSSLLSEHLARLQDSQPEVEMIDAWLDFSAIKWHARPGDPNGSSEEISWQYKPKPAPGYLVPLMTGYRAISPLYPAGEVINTRDTSTPFRFAEPIYGLGEWRGLHRIRELNELFWQYDNHDDEYRCSTRGAVNIQDYSEIDID